MKTAAERLNELLREQGINIVRREEILRAFALECDVLDACASASLCRGMIGKGESRIAFEEQCRREEQR